MSDSLLESNLAEVSPRQLIWQRFKRHRLAMLSVIFLLLIYLMAGFCEFVAPYSTETRNVKAINAPPMTIRFLDERGQLSLRPFVYGYDMHINADTWVREYKENSEFHYPIYFFSRGERYRLWGLVDTDLHFRTRGIQI